MSACRTYVDGEHVPHSWCKHRRTEQYPKGFRRCQARQRWDGSDGLGIFDAYGSTCAVSP